MKIKDVFEKSVQFFKDKKIETARLDTELLISHVLKIERLQIYLKYDQPLSEVEIQACRDVVRRRAVGEPVAYITEEKGFYGEIFKVGSGVLIPRPETELVVEEALGFIKNNSLQNPKVLDLGAGSGCIGFSILKNCETARLVSVEKSSKAFEYLRQNQQGLGLQDRSELFLEDVLKFEYAAGKFDIVVANPPYISSDDKLVEEMVKKFEPAEALFSEKNGYGALYDWSAKFKTYLKSPGLMLFEGGHEQGASLLEHFKQLNCFSELMVLKDLSGLDRVIKAVHTQ